MSFTRLLLLSGLHRLALALGVIGLGSACGGDALAPPNTPPTANFASSCTGLVCRFTNLSSDGDGQVTAYTWDFGDGGVAASKDAQHTYSAASTYRVKLTVTDDDGTSSDVTETIETRGPVNARPTANFTSSCTDLDCSFTDLSSDGDGTVVGFHWDFGDGVIAATRNSTHPYASAGTYVVELTVTDNSGATGNLSHQLTVTSPPTGAMIGLSQTSFYFCTPPGGSTRVCGTSGTLAITNLGTGTLDWKASSAQGWLRVSPTSGTAPSPNVTVSANTAGLTGSFYRGWITVSAAGASNSPQAVAVTLFRR